VADPKILKGGRKTIYQLRPFIANAHNEMYAFYTEKKRLFEKKYQPIGGGRPTVHPPPFESATVARHDI